MISRAVANRNPANDFSQLIRCRAVGRTAREAEDFAVAIGASDRVLRQLKDVGALTSAETAGDRASMVNDWIEASPKNSAAFLTMFSRGFRKMPIHARVAIMTGVLSASLVGEGTAKPLSVVSFDQEVLERKKTASLTIATREAWSDPRAESTINALQRYVVSTALDSDFFGTLANESDAIVFTSEGDDGPDAARDVLKLMLSVGGGADGAPFFVAGVEAAKRAAGVFSTGGLPVFAEMSPTGGKIRGVECLVSDGLATDSLALVNAASFAAAVESIQDRTTDSASFEMSATPANQIRTPTAAQMVSMFQTDSRAAMLEIFFAWEKLRDDAIAIVEDISWGGEIST